MKDDLLAKPEVPLDVLTHLPKGDTVDRLLDRNKITLVMIDNDNPKQNSSMLEASKSHGNATIMLDRKLCWP